VHGLVARFEPFDSSIVAWPHARFTGTANLAAFIEMREGR
jgi:hypothetical protein